MSKEQDSQYSRPEEERDDKADVEVDLVDHDLVTGCKQGIVGPEFDIKGHDHAVL